MSLQISRLKNRKSKLTITLMAVFALAMQPMYGAVERQVVLAVQSADDLVVINEIDPFTDKVELYNGADSDVVMNGWQLREHTAAGKAGSPKTVNASIAAKGYHVVDLPGLNNEDGDSVELHRTANSRQSVTFGLLDGFTSDVAFPVRGLTTVQRVGDGGSTWTTAASTIGLKNAEAVSPAPIVPEPVLDNINPTAIITSPADGLITRGNVLKVTGTASDENFSFYKLYLMQGTAEKKFKQSVENGVLDDTLDISNVTDGTYKLRLHVKDTAGNSGDAYAWVTIDRTAPVVTDLHFNEELGSVIVRAEADDIATHWFEIKLPNGSLRYVRKATTEKEVAFNLKNELKDDFTYGQYQIRYVVTDAVGNRNDDPNYTNSKVIRFTVNAPIVQPKITAENFNTVSNPYKGISVGFGVEHFKDVKSVAVELHRESGSSVVKTANAGVIDMINSATGYTQLTTPFVIEDGTFKEAEDTQFWTPAPAGTIWSATTIPTGVTVTIERENGPDVVHTFSQDAKVFTENTAAHPAYRDLLPLIPVTFPNPVQLPTGNTSSVVRGGDNEVIGGLPSIGIFSNPSPLSTTLGNTATPFGFAAFFPSVETEGEDDEVTSQSAVLGERDDRGNSERQLGAITPESAKDQNDSSLAWYWWVLIVAAIMAVIGWGIARLRHDPARDAYFLK